MAFTDQSTGSITAWLWDLGDNSSTVTTQNSSHTYSSSGPVTVNLTVTGSEGLNTLTKSDYITVITSVSTPIPTATPVITPTATPVITPKPNTTPNTTPAPTPTIIAPTAEYDADPITGFEPLVVKFTDKSTGEPSRWAWEFGDGDISREQSPTHTYLNDGNYTVILTVSNSRGSDNEEKLNLIAAKSIGECRAAFNADKTSGLAPLEVNFMDKSTGSSTSLSWNFGDGDVSSDQNPTHIFIRYLEFFPLH